MTPVFRIRSLTFAAILLTILMSVLAIAPSGPQSWISVSAQAAPKTADGDRFFLKIDGVDGEATETGHAGDIAARSFTWSESRIADSSSRVQTKDFQITMAFDKSSPLLMRKTAVRERIANAALVARNTLGQDYLKWTLTDVILTSFQVDGTTGHGKPIVTFAMSVGKMDVEYRPQLYNGGLGPAVKAGWEAK